MDGDIQLNIEHFPDAQLLWKISKTVVKIFLLSVVDLAEIGIWPLY
jgi:hypothetical protein